MIAFVAGRQLVQHVGRIEIERFGQDIGKHRLRAQSPHGAGGREEREAWHDHLIARPDTQRKQRKQDRIAARSATNGMFRPTVFGDRRLESCTCRAVHEGARIANLGQCGVHFAAQLRIFAVYIEHGDRNRFRRRFHGWHDLILNLETTCERQRLVRSPAPVNLKPTECLQPKLCHQIITDITTFGGGSVTRSPGNVLCQLAIVSFTETHPSNRSYPWRPQSPALEQ